MRGQVDGDHMVLVGQLPGHAHPNVFVRLKAVDQENGIAFAAFKVGHVEFAYLYVFDVQISAGALQAEGHVGEGVFGAGAAAHDQAEGE